MGQYRNAHLTLPHLVEAPAQPLSGSRTGSRTPPWQGTHPVLWFAQRYPLVFWSSLFSTMMLLTALATALLVTPLRPQGERPKVAPIVLPPVVQKAPEPSPLWALGAITGSCAIVSLLLTTSLSVANQRRRLIKYSIPAPHAEPRHRAQSEVSDAAPLPSAAAVTTVLSLAANLAPIALPLAPEGTAKKSVTPQS